MKFLRDTTWEEVFTGWREREASDPGWINCATKIKGWPDWESWRKFSARQIQADKLSWQIFEFSDPMNEMPAMLMGPYNAWQSRVPKKNKLTFEESLNFPEQREFFSKNEKILSMMKDFPYPTELIGVTREDNGKLVCQEGHHRAMAVTLSKKEGLQIDFKGPIRIAVAKMSKAQLPLLDQALKTGSANRSAA